MADAYWRAYANDPRFAALQAAAAAAMAPPQSVPAKRPRSDFGDMTGGAPQYSDYPPREDERGVGRLIVRDANSIGASYDQYLRNGQVSSYGAGDTARQQQLPGGMPSRPPVEDPRVMGMGGVDSRSSGYGSGRSDMPLPPDASNTLFVEGLPSDCTRREVSHIFRPFVGFREVRLVAKESRHPGGDHLVLCFVDFSNPNQAATALDALQGYKFDEHDRESANLRLQFARFPGPRSGGGPRGRR